MATNTLTAEIELEHRSLSRGVEEIREAGDLMRRAGRDDWARRAIGALEFLRRDLIPHHLTEGAVEGAARRVHRIYAGGMEGDDLGREPGRRDVRHRRPLS